MRVELSPVFIARHVLINGEARPASKAKRDLNDCWLFQSMSSFRFGAFEN